MPVDQANRCNAETDALMAERARIMADADSAVKQREQYESLRNAVSATTLSNAAKEKANNAQRDALNAQKAEMDPGGAIAGAGSGTGEALLCLGVLRSPRARREIVDEQLQGRQTVDMAPVPRSQNAARDWLESTPFRSRGRARKKPFTMSFIKPIVLT